MIRIQPQQKSDSVAVIGIVGLIALVSIVMLLGDSTATGAAARGAPPGTNFLAAKIFTVNDSVCVKTPVGASESYVVLDGGADFTFKTGGFPGIPFISCTTDADCTALFGSDSACKFVEQILLPERGALVQDNSVCGNGLVDPGEECDPAVLGPAASPCKIVIGILNGTFDACQSNCRCPQGSRYLG